MQLELQLIQLFRWVYHLYDNCPELKFQRRGNNDQPLFTDQESIIRAAWSTSRRAEGL